VPVPRREDAVVQRLAPTRASSTASAATRRATPSPSSWSTGQELPRGRRAAGQRGPASSLPAVEESPELRRARGERAAMLDAQQAGRDRSSARCWRTRSAAPRAGVPGRRGVGDAIRDAVPARLRAGGVERAGRSPRGRGRRPRAGDPARPGGAAPVGRLLRSLPRSRGVPGDRAGRRRGRVLGPRDRAGAEGAANPPPKYFNSPRARSTRRAACCSAWPRRATAWAARSGRCWSRATSTW
jgi:hypothetical protein